MAKVALPIRELCFDRNMEVLAGYDSGSSEETAKIQQNSATEQFAEPDKQDKQPEIAVNMESDLGNQSEDHTSQSSKPQETSEDRKEVSHHSSKRKGSPKNRQRNYRRRSASESPERSPERRSPEQSPVSRRRSRHSDHRDYHRHGRWSRSRSRSRSPIPRRRRSHSPRNSTNERDSGRRYDEFGRDIRPDQQRDSSEEKDKAGGQTKEREQSPSHRKSPGEKEEEAQSSPDRRGTNSPEKEDTERSPSKGKTRLSKSSDRDSPSPQRRASPDRRSKSPDHRRRRSRSRERRDSGERRSPERYRRRDYRRSPPRNSRGRRGNGDYSKRYDRNRDRDRDRGRDSRGGRDWGRDRRYDRDRDRNRDRDRDRDRQDEKATSPSQEKKTFVKATSTGQVETLPCPARPLTSEEVQAKLAAHAESLRKQAQDAASMLNLPSYLNPSVVNPHQYAVQAQKRKLLWSGKKTTEQGTANTSSSVPQSTLWNSTTFSNDQGGEMQAKFRRLMGIKGEGNAATAEDGTQPQNQRLMDDLEKEFERSRAFQLSRGAGGKSGIGLGYSGT